MCEKERRDGGEGSVREGENEEKQKYTTGEKKRERMAAGNARSGNGRERKKESL